MRRSGVRFPKAAPLPAHVFLPAGMSASVTTYTDDEPVAGLADGHVIAYGHPIPVRPPATFDAGARGVISTAADMAHWLVVQTNGGCTADGTRLVSERSMTEMHTPSTVGGYALGWDTYGPPAAPTRLEHSGNLLTFGAYQAVLPERGYGIALLFNTGSAFLLEQTAIFRGALQATATTIFRSWQLGRHLRNLANVPARPGQAAPRLTVLRKGRPEESP